jgi:inosine/xanthosine triphosphate pyrophosphatase family protein
MSPEEKDTMSHRGKALGRFKEYMKAHYSEYKEI